MKARGGQGKEPAHFNRIDVNRHFTLEVYTGRDLQSVEDKIGGTIVDLYVDVTEVSLRDDPKVCFVLLWPSNANFDGREGPKGCQEGGYFAKVVCRQEFKVGKAGELLEFLDGKVAFENVKPKYLQRRSIFKKKMEGDPAPLVVGRTVYLNPDLLELSPGRVNVEGGEDLIQDGSRCTELNLLDPLHVG